MILCPAKVKNLFKSQIFEIYNYDNFIKIFYDKELLAPKKKLKDFKIIIPLWFIYINYITICFNIFEASSSYISHILTIHIY